jgi:hypothetical protein
MIGKKELVTYTTEGREHSYITAFESWIQASENFFAFAADNIDKIRSKFRSAKTDEDLKDVLFELEVAFNIISVGGFSVEYEKYGCNKIGRAPDLSITAASGTELNIEVKRIREGSLGTKFQKLIDEIVAGINSIPSSIAFSFITEEFDLDEAFIKKLETAKDLIIGFAKEKVLIEHTNLAIDGLSEYEIPGFAEEITLILSKPKGKVSTDETSYHGGSFPIFYTQKESYKFGDAIFEKLGQMISGSINILVVTSDSSTHEDGDLREALFSIEELLRENNERFFVKKGFTGISDFISQRQNLSGILYKSAWTNMSKPSNFLWCNDDAANKIPDEIGIFLTGLGKRNGR